MYPLTSLILQQLCGALQGQRTLCRSKICVLIPDNQDRRTLIWHGKAFPALSCLSHLFPVIIKQEDSGYSEKRNKSKSKTLQDGRMLRGWQSYWESAKFRRARVRLSHQDPHWQKAEGRADSGCWEQMQLFPHWAILLDKNFKTGTTDL